MSAGMVQSYHQPGLSFQQLPHRKPLPPAPPSRPQSMRVLPEQLQQQYPTPSQLPPQMQQMQPGSRMSYVSTHPSSSATLPGGAPPSSYSYNAAQAPHPQMQNQSQTQYMPTAKRTLSNATTSSGGTTKVNSSASSTLQRSTSARSNQPTSYVALMRKQKATVWCDRAQQEDPRLIAQQRLAKQRAAIEVSSSAAAARGSNSGAFRSKMRHHGAPKAQQYTPDSHPAGSLPMRLSAREVDEDDSDDDSSNPRGSGVYHHRSGSGRSSANSARGNMQVGSQGMGGLAPPSGTSTVSSAAGASPIGGRSPNNLSTASSPQKHHQEYFGKANSIGEEDEELSFGGVGGLPQKRLSTEEEEARRQDLADLRRRGSVDERTMTMSGYGRLYVANPDLD